ncbi:MAG: hypothetical protein ACLR06_09995 [Christensenellaceae bacterium]
MTFDQTTKTIIDERRPADKIFNGGAVSVCYTLLSDDITRGKKPAATPYTDRREDFELKENILCGTLTRSALQVQKCGDGLLFYLEGNAEGLSEYGVNLPFNFMGKLDGGGWKNQFLFNSPYTSADKKIMYFYLTKPNGGSLAVAVLQGAAGWKMDYSDYAGGHYFINLKLLANFDRAYKTERRKNRLVFAIFPVNDFSDCLEKLSLLYGVPFLDYEVSGGEIGCKIRLKKYGEVDWLEMVRAGHTEIVPFTETVTLKDEGETQIVPVGQNGRGGGVTVYAYKALIKLYKKSMDSVDLSVVEKTDGNLCEHQCWANAMLRFLRRFGQTLTAEEIKIYEKKVKILLDVITETDKNKAVARRTIFFAPYKGLPAYNIFLSGRIQEEFFGITILLDAYRYFGEEKYYVYAVNTTDSLLKNYQKEDGRLETACGGSAEDYTTVCCAMIPLTDMANFLKDRDSRRAENYFAAAQRMAEYLYARGLSFPTEGERSRMAEAEMEEGSISCTALSLLYYCRNVRREKRYLEKAKEILDLHENWVIETPICQMKCSTLRWWETQWEGDADGPAICAGHAWTIWRAEADYLYYSLTGEEEYLRKAFNGFLTNLSKIDSAGKSYATYNPDFINGGGFAGRAEEVSFRIANRFADREDCGLSRYVWIRLNDTFLS